MFLLKVIHSLEQAGVKYAIAGGYAVALHGAVRGTMDVDIVIPQTERDYINAESALESIGLKCHLPVRAREVFRFRNEYIKNRNMLVWSFSNPDQPSEIVDVMITQDLQNLKVRKLSYGRFSLRIVDLEDLIQMKEESGRPQDLADAEALREIRRMKKK